MCSLVGAILMGTDNITLGKLAGGEFVIAIMCYYVLLYFIKKKAMKYIPHILLGIGIISLVLYCLWFPYKYETSSKGIYGITTLFRWIPYSAFMLLGAYMGLKRQSLKYKAWLDFMLMMLCLMVFYGVQFAAKKYPVIAPYQILTLLPLMGIVFYFWKWCHADFWKKIYSQKYGKMVIMTISGLCLESYLIQYSVFTTKMNGIFPLNLPIMVVIVLLVAFLCKCLSRWFSQTFKNEDYRWREIFKLY